MTNVYSWKNSEKGLYRYVYTYLKKSASNGTLCNGHVQDGHFAKVHVYMYM